MDATTPSPDPQRSALAAAVATPDPELACRLANVEWAIIAARLPWTTHTARIRELEAAGVVPDDANFDRMAAGVPR